MPGCTHHIRVLCGVRRCGWWIPDTVQHIGSRTEM